MNFSLRSAELLSSASIISNTSTPTKISLLDNDNKSFANAKSFEATDHSFFQDSSKNNVFFLNKFGVASIEGAKPAFINKENWAFSPECFVCTRKFNNFKGDFQHHCRFCGQSVCNQCSTHNISEQRSCDICYLRAKSKHLIERKTKLLNIKDKSIKELEKKIKIISKDIEDCTTNCIEIEKEKFKITKDNEESLMKLTEELKKCKQIYLKKQENYKRMEENVLVDKKILNDKESELTKSQIKTKTLKKSNQTLRKQVLTKNDDLNFIKHQLNKLQETDSFASLMHKTENLDSSVIVALVEKKQFSLCDTSDMKFRVNSMDNLEVNTKGPGETRRKITFYEKRSLYSKDGIQKKENTSKRSSVRTPATESEIKDTKNCLGCRTKDGKCIIY